MKRRGYHFSQFNGLRKNQKGQFYLLTAAIIIAVILGFSTISNTSGKTNSIDLKNMKEELKIEGENVIDYEINKNDPDAIREFFADYSDYIGQDIEFYLITKDLSGNFKAYKYVNGAETDISESLSIESKEVKINLNGNDYPFKIMEGKNFYFIISKNINENTYVTTN